MARVSVAVCRGCCCGTVAKHGEIDHQDQVDTLRAALQPATIGRLWETDCLGPCDRSNVIVVRSGKVRRWFGPVLSNEQTATLAHWLADGAPDQPPEELQPLLFQPEPAEMS